MTAENKLKISRILHAGYIFQYQGTQIAFDPIFENPFSGNCFAFPNVQFDYEKIKALKLDAVFISHFHDDHCSLESLNLLDRNTPIFLFCLHEELFSWIKELGFKNVFSLQIDSVVNVGSMQVTPRRALDSEVDCLFHVTAGDLNVLNVVDSWIDYSTLDQLKKIAEWDMILWPFQTMREIEVLAPTRHLAASVELPPEWIAQLQELKPKFIIPSSCQLIQEEWSWYRHAFFPITYQQFARQVKAVLPESEVIRLDPSVSIDLQKGKVNEAEPLLWVIPVGEQNLDYEYKPELKAPSTAEIAKKLAPLSKNQENHVYEYCRTGLLEKFRTLDAPEDTYFEKNRLWRLSIYNHLGEETHFEYHLRGNEIELTLRPLAKENEAENKAENEKQPNLEPELNLQHQISWWTEVPLTKLYAALTAGESLTSMYVRINDTRFSEKIEKEIQSADIIEDPLIRCLFNGVFCGYQKAQLAQIKARSE